MLKGRLFALSRVQPRYISPRTKARLAEKRRLLKVQSQSANANGLSKDALQLSRKPARTPKPKSHRRATMRVPMHAGFWRTLKWIFTGK